MDYKKSILKTILITFAVLIALTGIVTGLMFCVFTKATADIVYDLGNDKLASKLYYKSYKKSGDIECIYRALNIEIKFMNNNTTVEYFECFESDDEYDEFMKALKKRNENASVGILEKSTLLFEDNYLENNYINALCGIGDTQKEKALDRAVAQFKESKEKTFVLGDIGLYTLSSFILDDDVFDIVYDGFDNTLIEEMQEYFGGLCFELNKIDVGELTDLEKAYFVAIGNRVITIGQDINSRYDGHNDFDVLKEENVQKMVDINQIIKGLI